MRARPQNIFRAALGAALIACVALLTGCSLLLSGSGLRMSYNQGASLAYFWADRFVDFDTAQGARAQALLERAFAQQRESDLGDFGALLQKASVSHAQTSLPAARSCELLGAGQAILLRSLDRALPELLELARSLSPQQIERMKTRMSASNASFAEDFLSGSESERANAWAKRSGARYELIYGSLNEAQRQALRQAPLARTEAARERLNQRQAQQAEFLSILSSLKGNSPATQAAASARLKALATEALGSGARLSRGCEAMELLHASAGAEGRQKAAARLLGFSEDALRLRADAPAPAASERAAP